MGCDDSCKSDAPDLVGAVFADGGPCRWKFITGTVPFPYIHIQDAEIGSFLLREQIGSGNISQ